MHPDGCKSGQGFKDLERGKSFLWKNLTKKYFTAGQNFAFPKLEGEFFLKNLSWNNEYFAGAWIVKPVASSRGRGIFIVNHPNQVIGDGDH